MKRKKLLSSDEAHILEAINLKKKVNKMVITNGMLYLISHLPDFTTTLLLIVFKKKFSDFCDSFFPCNQLIEMAESFNFISMIFQLLIYFIFDKNFKESFLDKFAKKKKDQA